MPTGLRAERSHNLVELEKGHCFSRIHRRQSYDEPRLHRTMSSPHCSSLRDSCKDLGPPSRILPCKGALGDAVTLSAATTSATSLNQDSEFRATTPERARAAVQAVVAQAALAFESGVARRAPSPLSVDSSQPSPYPRARSPETGARSASPAASKVIVLQSPGGCRGALDGVEYRLSARVAHVEDLCKELQCRERRRELEAQRTGQRIAASECISAKLDCKVSEMSGKLRGLSDVVEAQIQRADTAQTSAQEVRHQLERDVQRRCGQLELELTEAASACRAVSASGEDAHKRLDRRVKWIETLLDEGVGQAISHLQTRVSLVEGAHEKSLSQDGDCCSFSHQLIDCERRVGDLEQTLIQRCAESSSTDGWSRPSSLEAKLVELGTKLEGYERRTLTLEERVHRECQVQVEQLREFVQDATRSFAGREIIDALAVRVEGAERSVEDMCAQHAEIAARAVREGSDRLMFPVPKVPGLEEITAHFEDIITRTASLETSVSFLRCQLEILRGETGLSSAKLCRGSETLEGEDRSRVSDQTPPSFVWPNSCELQGTVVGKTGLPELWPDWARPNVVPELDVVKIASSVVSPHSLPDCWPWPSERQVEDSPVLRWARPLGVSEPSSCVVSHIGEPPTSPPGYGHLQGVGQLDSSTSTARDLSQLDVSLASIEETQAVADALRGAVKGFCGRSCAGSEACAQGATSGE
uniref:Uncharacterized protein n=1 Tax=Noctiluca scintillans TaxID=2966 RepID=A0A7S1F743_NOCSC